MSFGVIIVCSAHDFALAKGCLASVKYFMPDVDVCLLIDGDPEISEVVKAYNVKILKRADIENAFLKEQSFGWGITKMNAFWESPFEQFVVIDADICLWGDVRKSADLKDYIMVVDEPQYSFDSSSISTWFFDTALMQVYDPAFEPQKYERNYFCTGIFFGQRGQFSLDWYHQIINDSKQNPQLFKYGEMGLLNYMIFKSVDTRKITVKNVYMQHICPDFEQGQTKKLFPFKDGKPLVIGRPMAIHYNGNRKPYQKNSLSYHQPMTYFRKMYYQKAHPELSASQVKKIMKEEDKPFERKYSFTDRVKNVVRPYVKPAYLKLKQLASGK